jgi:rare lipoprotein A
MSGRRAWVRCVACVAALVAAALAGAGCGAASPAPPPIAPEPEAPAATPELAPTPAPAGAPRERGRASYYSDRLAGRPTASGEPYNPRELTAAHRTLPFGSIVDVVRPDGRTVRVRINDRGPFKKGRVIDLSRRAAEAIGLVREGVADVTVVVVSQPPPRPKKKKKKT